MREFAALAIVNNINEAGVMEQVLQHTLNLHLKKEGGIVTEVMAIEWQIV